MVQNSRSRGSNGGPGRLHQDGHLPTEGQDFDSDISAGLEEDAGGCDQGEGAWQHGFTRFNMT